MKAPLIFLLMVALVLAQGLRLCVHAPDAADGQFAHAGHIHYESDADSDAEDSGDDFQVTYVLQGLDLNHLLAGASAFTLLLFTLLLVAGPVRLGAVVEAARRRPDGFRLRPPLRAPPVILTA